MAYPNSLFKQKYPYTDLHELNLDWLLKTVQEAIEKIEHIELDSVTFADPITWSIERAYEKNNVVINTPTGQGYISVKAVPEGVDITNTAYWQPIVNLKATSGYINVNFLGIDNTGATDVSDKIQSLIDSGYRALYFEGIYRIDKKLDIPSNFRMLGNNAVFDIEHSTTSPTGMGIANVQHVVIDGIGFKSVVNNGNLTNTLVIYKAHNVVITNCTFVDIAGISIIGSTNCDAVEISACKFANCGIYNLTTGESSDRRAAIAFTSGNARVDIHDNDFYNVGLDFISVTSTVDVKIHNNHLDTNYAGGIYISGDTNVTISDNTVLNCGGNGIDTINSVGLVISNNIVKNAAAGGVLLANIGGCECVGNQLLNNFTSYQQSPPTTTHQGGIVVVTGAACSHNHITGNMSGNNAYGGAYSQKYGIQIIDNGGQHGYIVESDNTFFDNTDSPMYGCFPVNGTDIDIVIPAHGDYVLSSGHFVEGEIYQINNNIYGKFIARPTQDPYVVYSSGDFGIDSSHMVYVFRSTNGYTYLINNSSEPRIFNIKLRRLH